MIPAVPSDSHLKWHSQVTDKKAAVQDHPRTADAIVAMRDSVQFRASASTVRSSRVAGRGHNPAAVSLRFASNSAQPTPLRGVRRPSSLHRTVAAFLVEFEGHPSFDDIGVRLEGGALTAGKAIGDMEEPVTLVVEVHALILEADDRVVRRRPETMPATF